MTIQINSYNTASTTNNNSPSIASNSGLSMQDFLKLLSAQLANQDVMNPSDNTEFISQMAQFTSLQTMQKMTEIVYAQYGATMIGKTVEVAGYDESGQISTDQGVVDSVEFSNGSCTITVNGKNYDLSAVMKVLK